MKVTTENKISVSGRSKKLPENQLAEKCRQFEAVFLKKLLEVSQPKNGLFGTGVQGDFYRDFYLEELAKEISSNPGIGLAESIYRALVKEEKGEEYFEE